MIYPWICNTCNRQIDAEKPEECCGQLMSKQWSKTIPHFKPRGDWTKAERRKAWDDERAEMKADTEAYKRKYTSK